MKIGLWMSSGLRFVLIVLLGVSLGTPSFAEPKKEGPKESEEIKPSSGRPPKKVRQGSLLRRDKSLGPEVDLRSTMQKWRDKEMVFHFQTMAELDILSDVAKEAKDMTLFDRIEVVRRFENARFKGVMRRLHAFAQAGTELRER
ncbi:hypothetical protein KAI87_12315 [Myxococcota bacterium]|nr:hypothetical protein [Myxococcota bacterium]